MFRLPVPVPLFWGGKYVSVWNGCDPESGFGDKYLEQTSVCFVGKEKELDPCIHPLSRRSLSRNSVILPTDTFCRCRL